MNDHSDRSTRAAARAARAGFAFRDPLLRALLSLVTDTAIERVITPAARELDWMRLARVLPTNGGRAIVFLARFATCVLISSVVSWMTTSMAFAQCACMCPSTQPPFFRAGFGHTLSANARVLARLGAYLPETLAVTTTDGVAVPFRLEPAGDEQASAFWIVPDAPLRPVAHVFAVTARDTGIVTRAQVSVRPETDTTPPEISGLSAVGTASQEYCAEIVGGTTGWDYPSSTNLDSDLSVEVELVRAGTVIGRVFPDPYGVTGSVAFGSSTDPSCFGSAHIAGLVEGEHLTARVRVWDIAGNATPFTELDFVPGRTPVRGADSCQRGCAVRSMRVSPPPIAWALLSLLFVARWRGRTTGKQARALRRPRLP